MWCNLNRIVVTLGLVFPHPTRFITLFNYNNTLEENIHEVDLLISASNSQTVSEIYQVVKCILTGLIVKATRLLNSVAEKPLPPYEAYCVEVLRCTLDPDRPLPEVADIGDQRMCYLQLEYQIARELRRQETVDELSKQEILESVLQMSYQMIHATGDRMPLENLFARMICLRCNSDESEWKTQKKIVEELRASAKMRVPEGWEEFYGDILLSNLDL